MYCAFTSWNTKATGVSFSRYQTGAPPRAAKLLREPDPALASALNKTIKQVERNLAEAGTVLGRSEAR
jgi:hypothetical protein